MKEQTQKSRASGWVRAGAVALVGLAVIAGVLLWARSNSGATTTPNSTTTTTQSGSMMQTNEGGQITVKVAWQGRNAAYRPGAGNTTSELECGLRWSPPQRDAHLPGDDGFRDASDRTGYPQYYTGHPQRG